MDTLHGAPMRLASESEWLESISKNADVQRNVVEDILRKHGVRAQSTAPRSRKVIFTAISFAGIKEEVTGSTPFDFKWDNLGTGLWALMSDDNLRGKSSILNILKAALHGDFPGDIKPDIWRWLSEIRVQISIDQVGYGISIAKENGDRSSESCIGALARLSGDTWIVLYEGELLGLKSHVDSLFMEELGFAKIHAVNKEGTQYAHSWPAVASALAIGGNTESKALFGELLVDGLPLRLLQLFIGMPWVSTLTAITTAKKIVAPSAQPANSTIAALRTRLAEVEREMAAINGQNEKVVSRELLRRKMSDLDIQLAHKQSEVTVARKNFQISSERHENTRVAQIRQARLTQELKDEKNAGYVFRNLRPECCPACEASFHAPSSKHDGSCILCKSEQPIADKDITDIRLKEAEGNLIDITNVLALLAAELDSAREDLSSQENARAALEARLEAAQASLGAQGDDLELRFAALSATSTELRTLLSDAAEQPNPNGEIEKKVLKAAETQTRALIDGLQTQVLEEVAEGIMRLSSTFGVRNLSRASLNGQGHLKLIQGGADTNFSRLTKGERLRVKIAAALSAVQVARVRGLGRHPGLLILDSPGAEEVVDADFHEMLANVSEVANQIGGVQVLIGTTYRKELEDVVPKSNRRHAEGHAFLF